MTDDYQTRHDAKVIADLEAINADLARAVEPLRKALAEVLDRYITLAIAAAKHVEHAYDPYQDPLVLASRKALAGDVG